MIHPIEESMSNAGPELLVVMPVYNEQASVRKVVLEWFQEIENWTERFLFLAINDGSTDGTEKILTRLRGQLGQRFEVINRENRGHGQTCLQGYRIAVERKIPHVFQIDSDGQCDPQYFFRFWRDREHFDVIYGKRRHREDGWRRTLASFVLKLTLLLFGRVYCVDANAPYRLMRTDILQDKLSKIPPGFFLANVALAILLKRDAAIRHGSVAIGFRERYGGEPLVRIGRFGEKAFELVAQLKRL
jgi:dolichol-phosphate mannosyltransferase